MRVSDFHYELPRHLIAQRPTPMRSDSRLLLLDGCSGELQDRSFADLPTLLAPGDLLVFNDTRVIRARLYGRKATGGKVEILVERVLSARRALAQMKPARMQKPGGIITLEEGYPLIVIARRQEDLFEIEFMGEAGAHEVMEKIGHVPLPPYIARADETTDGERYQTIYSRLPGAVAAPTAGLHFDQQLLSDLQQRGIATTYVTLHVGAGTFQPVRAERLDQHRMHSEYMEVSEAACAAVKAAQDRGGRVVAVGTTSVRALETAAAGGELRPIAAFTDIFITPGFSFRVVDAMVTNFHLPESTLLMLVCAFAGREQVLTAYQHAVRQRYRFYSYGDAMLALRGRAGL